MNLTKAQQRVIDKMEHGKEYNIYQLETSHPTMKFLERKKLVRCRMILDVDHLKGRPAHNQYYRLRKKG